MSKIWWRLADVSPLAEHAVHTPTVHTPFHLLQPARTQIGAPALIWERDEEGGEGLRSNGSPGWFDEHGQPHRAYALTWRHPASGRSGDYDHADLRGDLVQLTIRHRSRTMPSVIETIRSGVTDNHHWLWIDTTRWPFTVGTADHRDEIVPADAAWIAAEVTSPDIDGHGIFWEAAPPTFPALIAEGYEDADGVLPRFTRDTVAEIISRLDELNEHRDTMPGEFPTVAFDGDAAVITAQRHDLSDQRVMEIDRCHPDADGLYALGAYLWTWTQQR